MRNSQSKSPGKASPGAKVSETYAPHSCCCIPASCAVHFFGIIFILSALGSSLLLFDPTTRQAGFIILIWNLWLSIRYLDAVCHNHYWPKEKFSDLFSYFVFIIKIMLVLAAIGSIALVQIESEDYVDPDWDTIQLDEFYLVKDLILLGIVVLTVLLWIFSNHISNVVKTYAKLAHSRKFLDEENPLST